MDNRFNRLSMPMYNVNSDPQRTQSNQPNMYPSSTPLSHFQPANNPLQPINEYHKSMNFQQNDPSFINRNGFNQFNMSQSIPLGVLNGRDIGWANTAPFYPSKDHLNYGGNNYNSLTMSFKPNYDEKSTTTSENLTMTTMSQHMMKQYSQEEYDEDDDDEDDDDDETRDDDEIKSGKTVSTRSSRPTVREHSKAQREKRKLYIMSLEEKASLLSDDLTRIRQRIEEDYETLAVIHEAYYLQIEIFLQLLFQSACDNKETIIQNHFNNTTKKFNESIVNKTWNDVLESKEAGGFSVHLPLLNFAYQPCRSFDKLINRLTIVSVNELDIYSQGLLTAYETIARIGTNLSKQLLMSIKINTKTYVVVNNIASLQFDLLSKNARLLGGIDEIKLKVFARLEFSKSLDGDKLKTVEIYFDALDFHKQMSESFSPSIYRPITMRNYKISGEPNSLQGLSQFVTSINNFSILSLNNHTKVLFDQQNIQHLVISDEYVTAIQEKTMKWLPFTKYVGSLNEICLNIPQSKKSYNLNYYVQVYPYNSEASIGISGKVDESILPNRLFWIVHECRPINDLNLCIFLISDFLDRIITIFNKEEMNKQLLNNNFNISESVNFLDVLPINHIIKLATNIYNNIKLVIDSTSLSLSENRHILYQLIHEFLSWVSYVDNVANQDSNSKSNQNLNDISNDIGDNDTNSFIFTSSKYFISTLEKSTMSVLMQELNNFFFQIRESNLIPRLLLILNQARSEEEIKSAEGFLFLCWTRHSNSVIHSLLQQTRKNILLKKYNDALDLISKILEIDPHFAEAYNKRATVYFGMKQSQDCFNDIDLVLKLEPYHYGALCGKGLMLMKLGEFAKAIESFHAALNINPSLKSGSLGKTLSFCKDRLETVLALKKEKQVNSALPPTTVLLPMNENNNNNVEENNNYNNNPPIDPSIIDASANQSNVESY